MKDYKLVYGNSDEEALKNIDEEKKKGWKTAYRSPILGQRLSGIVLIRDKEGQNSEN